jgi:hypothetical protein
MEQLKEVHELHSRLYRRLQQRVSVILRVACSAEHNISLLRSHGVRVDWWNGLIWLRIWASRGCSIKRGNEPSATIKCGEFLD